MGCLFCAKNPVSGIAEAGNDISVFVQVVIQRRDVDIHVRMVFLHLLDPFGGADDTHQLDMPNAGLLQECDRRGRAASRGAAHGC